MNEQIIKKEDKLYFKGGFLKNKRGTLALTSSTLSFATKSGKSVFSIPIKDIVSVNTKKGFGAGVDHLFVLYNDRNVEKKIKIEHRSAFAAVTIGNLARLGNSYFSSWEDAINNVRFGKTQVNSGSNIDDLEKLADLKKKGVISDEEFAAKKKQILGL